MKHAAQMQQKPKVTNGGRHPSLAERELHLRQKKITKPRSMLVDSSHGFILDSLNGKLPVMSDEEGTDYSHATRTRSAFFRRQGHLSRNHYAEINNLDSIGTTEKLGAFNKPKPVTTKRPPSSIVRKNVGFDVRRDRHTAPLFARSSRRMARAE